jgi:hypothetical protein
MNALRTLIVEDDAMIAGLLAETLEGHCQSKFYTACSRTRAGWSSTVFARELPPRSAEFNAENRLYSFALMVWTSPARHLAQ